MLEETAELNLRLGIIASHITGLSLASDKTLRQPVDFTNFLF